MVGGAAGEPALAGDSDTAAAVTAAMVSVSLCAWRLETGVSMYARVYVRRRGRGRELEEPEEAKAGRRG